MTLELLLLLLGGAIVSNVVLLIAASRSGALRDDRGVSVGQVTRSLPVPVAEQTWSRPAPVSRSIPPPARPASPPRRAPEPAATPPAADAEAPGTTPRAAEPEAPAADSESTPTTTPETEMASPAHPPGDAPPATTTPRPASAAARPVKGRRGRRFVLPPIDVDHARTERVMLSLLSTDDPLGARADETPPPPRLVDAWEQLVGPDHGEAADRSAIVVALTIEGIERLGDVAGRGPAERIVTAVLDSLRRSARATDRVASVGRGHFRVLLVDADEAVAGEFVKRVRAAVERRLAAAPVPLDLVAGWAEAASVGHLEAAVHQAEERRRAAAALEEARERRGRAPA